MPTILVAGTQNQPFGSFSQTSQSQDGVNWTTASSPFPYPDSCTGIASNGSLNLISNQRGLISATTDFVNFNTVNVNQGFGSTCFGQHNSTWLIAGVQNYINGYGPYPPYTEVAQIFYSTYGSTGWRMVWTHPNNSSYFYSIQFFPNAPITSSINADVWVAVGNSGYNSGDIWYSVDNGISWAQADIPVGVGVIFSVMLYNLGGTPTWYWGCRGKIYLSNNLHNVAWNELGLTSNDTAVGFVQDGSGALLVNGINTLYTSLDGLFFNTFQYPGYVWATINVLPLATGSRWLAFARSNLIQYTYWYSDNFSTWTPLSNGITVQASTVF
jgi:hypothetical protein